MVPWIINPIGPISLYSGVKGILLGVYPERLLGAQTARVPQRYYDTRIVALHMSDFCMYSLSETVSDPHVSIRE